MQRDRLARSLTHLGIDPRDSQVLKLLPLVYTAWANGVIEKAAAKRIHALASVEFNLSDKRITVLEH